MSTYINKKAAPDFFNEGLLKRCRGRYLPNAFGTRGN